MLGAREGDLGVRGPTVAIAAVGLMTGLALVTLVAFGRAPIESVFPRLLYGWVIAIAVAGMTVLLAAAWAVVTLRSSVSLGLVLVAIGLLVPAWAAAAALPAGARAATLAFAPLAIAGATHAGLRWGTGRSRGLIAVYGLAVAAALIHLLAYDPFDDVDCLRTCLAAPPILGDGLAGGRTVIRIVAVLTILAAGIGLLVLARRGSGGAGRRVTVASMIALVILAADAALGAVATMEVALFFTSLQQQVVLEGLAAGILGVGVLSAAGGALASRRAIRDLARELAGPLGQSRQRSVIRRVDFAIASGGGDERTRWVDGDGRPAADPPPDLTAVVVADHAIPVLRLLIGRGEDPGDVLAGLTPAARLALRNAQLTATTRAQVAEVRRSQLRIVAASDAERRRIERDLHDGAQQRLVSARFHLGHARNRLPDPDGALASADSTVETALERLRRLGHGIFPTVLASEGLEAALDDLAGDASTSVTVEARGLGTLGTGAAMAAYAAAVVVVDHARGAGPDASTGIRARVDDGWLTVDLRWSGSGRLRAADVSDIVDRVEALGGVVRADDRQGGFALEVRVPCGS
jgi:signal transduction histidine kinase